jgi:hypothetical protein
VGFRHQHADNKVGEGAVQLNSTNLIPREQQKRNAASTEEVVHEAASLGAALG